MTLRKQTFLLVGILSLFLGNVLFSAETKTDTPKKLAPGVMTTIRPFVDYSDTYQWSTMSEIVGQASAYDWARDLFYNKEVWCLEFSFKKIRMIEIDFPTEKGTMVRHRVWYMIYSVTNTGKCLKSEVELKADNTVNVMVQSGVGQLTPKSYDHSNNNLEGTYRPKEVDYNESSPDEKGRVPGSVRFVPQFVLASSSVQERLKYQKSKETGEFISLPITRHEVVYYDEFLPLAFVKIAVREDPNQKFESTITLPTKEIKPGETLWGIATWLDVDRDSSKPKLKDLDPRIDRFSVYISGLTNAIRWEDSPAAYNPNAKFLEGRTIFRKVLKLNFFRPGDEFDENEKEIYFGQPGELDYQWIYL